MTLDTSGRLLEGIRSSIGNNSLTFPARNFISDPVNLNAGTFRFEYAIVATSLDPTLSGLSIADPNLVFQITKNEASVVRFGYDNFSRRFLPLPGGPPDSLGPISNTPRLVIPPPDLTITGAPIGVYVGFPTRAVTFNVVGVPTETDFTASALLLAGTIEVSLLDGKLNFGDIDLSLYAGRTVYATRQSFLSREQANGVIGELTQSPSVDYFLFLNPKPATGQTPQIRIDYQSHLIPIEVPTEATLGTPSPGTVHWSLDTGRVRFAPADISVNLGRNVYYDGVFTQFVQLARTTVGSITNGFPVPAFVIAAAVGVNDSARFIVAVETTTLPANSNRRCFPVTIINLSDFPSDAPNSGTVYLESTTGAVYFNGADVTAYASDPLNVWSYLYIDAVVEIENGVSVQFYRSGVNGSGIPSTFDFTMAYNVTDQIIQPQISGSPFAMLPTTPILDSTLGYKVIQGVGSTGSFIGDLSDGTDPTKPGFGYLFNLDKHSLQYSNRKTISKIIDIASPILKLDDGAVSEFGIEITKNGGMLFARSFTSGSSGTLTPGIDFVFNSNTGTIEFIGPVGENDPNNTIGISGQVISPNIFTASGGVFVGRTGGYLFIASGNNTGLYIITEFTSPNSVKVTPNFVASGATTADYRAQVEIVADRFWTPFLPPYKKFVLMKADSGSSSFTTLNNTQFTIFKTTGQVNLVKQTKPGEVYQISYISLDSTDGGVTTTPTNRIEKALFKIRQEIATVTVGSSIATFNPTGKTINIARDMAVYVDSIPLDTGSFVYKAPNVMVLPQAIQAGQTVVIDYWVEEAPGGDTNFNLLFTPVDLDTPEIVQNQQTSTFNSDQTNVLAQGSAILINNTDVVIVNSSAYNPGADTTTVQYTTIPIVSSNGAPLQVTQSIIGSYRINETNSVDVFTQNTNSISISGRRDVYYNGTVVTVDSDPYLIQSASYDATNDKTTITTTATARRNYIIPSLTYTVRPVLTPNSQFQTKQPADIDFPFTLIKMGNSTRLVLIDKLDYTISEGGQVQLSTSVKYGDSLYAMYVKRVFQPAGTLFTINYAYVIAPNGVNGIQGQRLTSTYDLYAPDSFYYRIETIPTFVTEVSDELQKSSGSNNSGPNISDVVTSVANKDCGNPSPWFDEQHQGNVDTVVARLLKCYNDSINVYEDILSDLDGRIVGGNSGRFRFDGLLDNPPRANYYEVTNDIDDRVGVYLQVVLTGFFSFNYVPVYFLMGDPCRLSRLFPTYKVATAALNDQTDFFNFGNTMGSLGVSNINNVDYLISSRGRIFFDQVSNGTTFTIAYNGNPNYLIPAFEIGQKVRVYKWDGTPDVIGTVMLILPVGLSISVMLDTPTTLTSGSLLRDLSDDSDTTIRFYTPGKDLSINNDNGQINNFTLFPPFSVPQTTIQGNEIIDAPLSFNNSNIDPARIPVLDGIELNDDGSVPAPLLRRTAESQLLNFELTALSQIGKAKVAANLVNVATTIPGAVGYTLRFLTGPNAGQQRVINSVVNPTHFVMNGGFPFADPAGSDCKMIPTSGLTIDSIWNQEVKIIETGTFGPPPPLAQVGSVDSEVISCQNVLTNYGTILVSGTGSVTSDTIVSDPLVSFTALGVTNQCFFLVPSGGNLGLYKISTVTTNTITIDGASPFAVFPVLGSTPYTIVEPYGFFSNLGAQFVTEFLRETSAFLNDTKVFSLAPTDAGKAARVTAINTRLGRISYFKDKLTSILKDGDQLYDLRYTWIQQRTNRSTGALTRKNRAAATRQSNILKTTSTQRMLKVLQSL